VGRPSGVPRPWQNRAAHRGPGPIPAGQAGRRHPPRHAGGILGVMTGGDVAGMKGRRAEFEAREFAVSTPTGEMVGWLRQVLGPRLVAFIGGVSETRATRQWAEGTRSVSAEVERRLRDTAQVTHLIASTFDAHTAQAWMQGLDPMLDDRSPAWTLRSSVGDDDRRAVVASARRFAIR
jgi:hypothetical protein